MHETVFTFTLVMFEIAFSAAVLRTLALGGASRTMLVMIGFVLGAWLATVYALLAIGFFAATEMPQLSFSVGVALPAVLGYVVALSYGPLRRTVDAISTKDFLKLQYWRAAFGILFFFTDALPFWFKCVGGLGDIAAGVGAFVAADYLKRRPTKERAAILRGNIVGILDFAVVLNLGVFVVLNNQSPDIAFDLIPLYVVPVFILLHIASVGRLRRM